MISKNIITLIILCSPIFAHAASLEGGRYSVGMSLTCTHALGITEDVGNWKAGLLLHTKEVCKHNNFTTLMEQNLGVYLARNFTISRWNLGLGVALWEHQDYAVGSSLNRSTKNGSRLLRNDHLQLATIIYVEFDIYRSLYIAMRHSSTAGASEFNKGHDWLMLGWRF